jgi:hypothetical protein
MATTTTLANDIGVIVGSELVQGFFRNDEFFSLFTQRQAPPDTNYRWHILTAGLTGTLKAEGDAFSAAQSTTNSRAALGYHRHDAVVSVTDDLRAALGPSNSNSYWQSLAQEVVQARAAVQQAIMTRWLGATAGTDGLQLAIDSTGTYAGLDHAAITGWASTETAVSAALSYAALDDLLETLRDDPIRSKPTLFLMPENQVTNYTRLSGPGVRQTFNIMSPGGQGNNFDIGPSGVQSFSNVPIQGVAELTDTVILAIKREDAIIQYRDDGNSVGGGWGSEEIPRGGYATQVAINWYGHLAYIAPRYAGKLTGVTA